MPNIDQALVSAVVRSGNGTLAELQRAGIDADSFVEPEWKKAWVFVQNQKRAHGKAPNVSILKARYPELRIVKVDQGDLPHYVDLAKKRAKWHGFVGLMEKTLKKATDMDAVDVAVADLEDGLKRLYMDDQTHMIDVFDSEFTRRIYEDVKQRGQDNSQRSILSGLSRLDEATHGGFFTTELITVIGRTGKGKSWLSCLFVRNGVSQGRKFILYPLEMGIEETMLRLYPMFAQDLAIRGIDTLRNSDLVKGTVDKRKFKEFLKAVNADFKGTLLVSDSTRMKSSYTIDKIAADVEKHRPAAVWIDYVTLLKRKGGGSSSDWQVISDMSSELKMLAAQYGIVVGINAQVNRSAIKNDRNIFLPRPEHISFGDAIAANSNKIISMNREDDTLYYSLPKNRGGREFGKTPVRFQVDEGIMIEESLEEDLEDEEL